MDSDPAQMDRRSFAPHFEISTLYFLIILIFWSVIPTLIADDRARFADMVGLYSGQWPAYNYSVIQEIISLPLYWVGSADTAMGRVAYLNLILLMVIIFAIRETLDETIGRRFALLLLTASMFPFYIQTYCAEILGATTMTLGVLWLEYGKKWWLSGLLFALGIANTPATLPAFALAVSYFAFRKRAPKVLLLIPVPFAVFSIEYVIRYGSLSAIPYLHDGGPTTIMPYSGRIGFSYPFGFGLLSILFSFGKGLIFFVPALLLRWTDMFARLPRSLRVVVDTWLAFVLGLIFTYAKWWAWYGGYAWGPRFFLFACIPACGLTACAASAPSLSRRDKILAGLALTLSAWGCAISYAYGLDYLAGEGFEACVKNDWSLEMLCWYTPEWSPLWRGFVIGFGSLDGWKWLYVASIVSVGTYILILLARKPFAQPASESGLGRHASVERG